MNSVPFWQVDAFTDRRFSGNPAAVCRLENEASDEWMQAVAAEMNLSETAFVRQRDDCYELRWFTPALEVDLCGHATLAAAHVLWSEELHSPQEQISFQSRSGLLTCRRDGNLIEMDFPATPTEKSEPPPELLKALGMSAAYVGRTRFDYLVVVSNPAKVPSAAPDFSLLKQIETRGVILTSHSDDERYDFISRFFAPAVGVDEDPVTGSAHCALGPYWAPRLNKTKLVGFQTSNRGGLVHVEPREDRVLLGGEAVTVLRGQILTE